MTSLNEFLKHVSSAKTVVIDLETNSLDAFGVNSRILGYSLYLPDLDVGMYIPFNHGSGRFEVSYTDRNSAATPFASMTWQGDTKKALWLNYWWDKWRRESPAVFGNLDHDIEALVVEALDVSGKSNATWVLHNAQFDLSWLANKGITISENIYDTMIGMHVLQEDMRGIKFSAPYKWSRVDFGSGLCKETQVGDWARDADGELLLKDQFGNYQLKWLCAMLGFDGATTGEESLHEAAKRAMDLLAEYIASSPDDPYNAGLNHNNLKQVALDKMSGYLDKKANMWTIPADGVSYYAELDTKLTWQLHQYLLERLATWDNLDLYKQQCQVLRFVTWPVYYRGVRLDVQAAEFEREDLEARQRLLLGYTKEVVGDAAFNPGSGQQILRFINGGGLKTLPDVPLYPYWWEVTQFKTYNVPGKRPVQNEHGVVFGSTPVPVTSTAAEVLEQWEGHPFIRAIVEYRKIGKTVGTYLNRWLENRDGYGVIHPSLNITGTVSGRLSSSGEAGNFQNIPDRNGYEMKRALVPLQVGYKVVGIDYGQLELRLATWIAESVLKLDSSMPMTTLFEKGVDMHAHTRDMVNVRDILYPTLSDEAICLKLGYDVNKVTSHGEIVAAHCRFVAKTMNFGLLYGGGGGMLSKLLGLDRSTSDALVYSWRRLYPAFGEAGRYYLEQALSWRNRPNQSELSQYVTQPITGRHRRFNLYDEYVTTIDPITGVKQVWNEREQQARKAWNNVVQGLGGELAKDAALQIVKAYPQVHVFNIVHDSIDLFVPENELDTIIFGCELAMTNWNVRPALTVDVVVGDNWQDVKKWQPKQKQT